MMFADTSSEDVFMSSYQHLLFATDLSKKDEEGAMRAAEIARKFRAQLTLLHIVPEYPENVPNDPIAPENIDPTEFLRARAHRALDRLARLIGRTGAKKKVIFTGGAVKQSIVEVARDIGADMILLAASGHH